VADEQSPLDSELTPEQESTVRDLLAQARHDEPVPDAVAARLERALVRLGEEETDGSAPVADLSARRRRRNAGRLLLGAAAIVLGGVAVGQFLGPMQGSGDDAGSVADTSAERGGAASEFSGADSDGQGNAPSASQPAAADQEVAPGVPVRLSRRTFDEDVQQLARSKALRQLEAAAAQQDTLLDGAAPTFECPPAAYGRGTLVPAYYEDEPAVLAFRPPLGSNRVADLLECGTAAKLRSVNLNR